MWVGLVQLDLSKRRGKAQMVSRLHIFLTAEKDNFVLEQRCADSAQLVAGKVLAQVRT